MRSSTLTALQRRLLVVLAGIVPPWILTGGAALAGFYTHHRSTRDLDLRWPERSSLVEVSRSVLERLQAAGLSVESLQSSPSFARFRVADGTEVVLLDLMADSTPSLDTPTTMAVGTASILVDTRDEILVSKVCALLGRMELRDLDDVRVLLATGGDLHKALKQAPLKDGGFSPLQLAWVLEGMGVERLALAAGWSLDDAVQLDAFRQSLIDQLLAAAAPS